MISLQKSLHNAYFNIICIPQNYVDAADFAVNQGPNKMIHDL